MSRRKRKRERRNAEATAKPLGGWGEGITLSEFVLLRTAINSDWPVSADVRQEILRAMETELSSPNPRKQISVVRCYLAMEEANLRAG